MNIQDWLTLGLTDFFLPAVQETLKSFLWHHNLKALIILALSWERSNSRLYIINLFIFGSVTDQDNHDGVITHLEPDILECEVKWDLGSINMNKASGGDGIPVELFQILKEDAVKVLHSICKQIWKTQQWSQD